MCRTPAAANWFELVCSSSRNPNPTSVPPTQSRHTMICEGVRFCGVAGFGYQTGEASRLMILPELR